MKKTKKRDKQKKIMELRTEEIKDLKKDLSKNLSIFFDEHYKERKIPVDIFKILNNIGFDVYYADLGTVEGVMVVDESVQAIEGFKGNKIMVVNSQLSYASSVFALAHELAHYLVQKWLYPNKKIQVEFREHIEKGMRSNTENFIDFIAASILMPSEQFKQVLAEKKISKDQIDPNDVRKVAKIFEVDYEAALRRVGEVFA